MNKKYVPPANGPTASITFTTSKYTSLEYDIFKCKELSWDNIVGYLKANNKTHPTTKVVADKPLLLRILIQAGPSYSGAYTGVSYFSFIPENHERYIVKTKIGEDEKILSKTIYFYVEKADGTTVPIKQSYDNFGLRKVIADWPECT